MGVVLVNTNEGRFLERALGCLKEQTLPPERVIVVDNASSDGSPEMVAERFPEVELIRLGRNAGFAAANNAGVRATEGCEWVALLNPDAFPEPGWLEALRAAGEAHPGLSFLASRMMIAGAPGRIDGIGDAYHVSGWAWPRDHGRPLASSPDAARAAEVFSACGGAAVYRRDAFLSAGGFDESFFGYYEDTDLAFRLRLLGHRGRYVPDAVVEHVGSGTTGRESDFKIYHSHRNMVWTFVRDMPGSLLARYLGHHLLMNLMTVAFYAGRGQGRAIMAAKRDAVRGLPRVLRERRRLQAARSVPPGELRRVMATGGGAYLKALRGAMRRLRARLDAG